ncbi:hypothetical protein L207DRAFT_507072 [Hyaloscypha variabilis F]|uniref:Cylicin I n=1 Tax=Hyaloscypha variabilis (strain UAMH 11265 / GT02V1 / F) TaxID=1149755 RepID=A0A2J6S5U4_HYAVF|nr:hypothetical protein L207DRAFT_507072 [Hyaloscypha variabilis F]
MAFSRTAALRSCLRSARPTVARSQLFRQVARRGYASGGHGNAKAGGDAVWAAGAVAVTVPTCWYLLSNGPDTAHGHDDHGDSHGSAHAEEHEEEPKDEETEGEKSDDADGKEEESEKSEDSDSEDDKKDDTPDTSDDEGEDDDNNTKTAKPDAKGGIKKKSESKNAIKAGDTVDKAATSKPAGGKNTQSGKQEGLSNTDTKHSTDIASDPSKSSKGEGTPETGKAKGSVDPKRPQV